MTDEKLLLRLLRGSRNIRFEDLVRVARRFGFVETRVSGSHHIFERPGVVEILNIQNVKGQAKGYQVKQFLRIVEEYGLTLEEDR